VFPGACLSLFQEAVERVGDRAQFHPPIIVCNIAHRFIVSEQLRAIQVVDAEIIAEPDALNTAPALALAALHAAPDALLLVTPSDHRIADTRAFLHAVNTGIATAENGYIVTFAITPDSPEPGYGYIQFGEAEDDSPVRPIHQFIEKPDAATASALIAVGNIGWNSGIFLLSAQHALAELSQHAPEVLLCCRAAMAACTRAEPFIYPDAAALGPCPSISIDYAIMEQSGNRAAIPVEMGWSDLGSFAALAKGKSNPISGNVITEDVAGCYIHSDGPLVAALGVRDLVIIAADNAVLVKHKDSAYAIKPLLQRLRDENKPDINLIKFAHRPWGSFYRIDQGEHYQVKRLHLKPGARISLQSHTHRSEHWIVVEGRASVTNGDHVTLLEKNQSTYIPAGAIHRLENCESSELVIIEVQTGDYLGEDDIARFEDSYHRN
jgi:mannose-1-phosphate guanylyltransferase/mannose-6-phosphate isomerase